MPVLTLAIAILINGTEGLACEAGISQHEVIMSEPIISIVIPCYNHGQYIDEAIQSVEEYKEKNYEIIIVNDGSTDEFTNQRLKELKAKGYHVIFQDNQGLGATRNNAIRLAKGKYILPLDADNKIKPDLISKGIKILDANSSISIVYSDRQIFGNSKEIVKTGRFELPFLLKGNYIDTCAVYRKKVWDDVGGYDETLRAWEDWDFWLSAAEKGFRFFYIPQPLFYYRVLEDSMIHSFMKGSDVSSLKEYIHKKHMALILRETERLRLELKTARRHPLRTMRKSLYRKIRDICVVMLNN